MRHAVLEDACDSSATDISILQDTTRLHILAVDRRRNRLGHGKSNMLVGLFHNLRLLKRMRKLLYTEQCVGWNDEDEKTGSFALVLSSL